MSNSIPASAETLMKQASMTANDYLYKAQISIDKILGDGYAERHPELLAAMIQTAATDVNTAIAAQHTELMADRLREGLEAIASAITAKGGDS